MTITYTIANFCTNEVQSGLSARDVAAELLGHDGAEWEIRDNGETGFDLWHRKTNAGKPWTMTVIYSIEEEREAAEKEIFDKVIASGYWDRDDMFAGTDEQYRRMLAEQEGE